MPGPNAFVGLTVVSKALKLTLDKTWGDQPMNNLDWMQSGFKTSNTTDAYVDDQEYAHTGLAPAVAEAQLIPLDAVTQGYSKRYYMIKYGLRMVVSEEALDDCKYEDAIAGTKSINRSLRLSQEYEAANIFINSFSSSFVGGDAVALCSTSHPLPRGGTASNTFSTAMSLSETAVEQMWINMSQLPGSNGYVQAGYELKQLTVPKSLEPRANRILRSEKQNDTANNAMNFMKGMGVKIASNRYFTSTTNWWGVSDLDNGLRFIWRKKPLLREHNTEDNYTKSFVGIQRFGVGWSDWRDVYGSNI
jgi:hypothetical protein